MISLRATCIALHCAFIVVTNAIEPQNPLSDEFIDLINTKQTSWKAGRNFPLYTSFDQIKKLMGAMKDDFLLKLEDRRHDDDLIASLPENFDPREKWPNCPSLNEIRDQGFCNGGWAFAAVEAMTDRYCTYSNGTKHFHFSAQDLLSCCSDCGPGCRAGYPTLAWDYWTVSGLVSGGAYNTSQGCRPYEKPPCEHYFPNDKLPCSGDAKTPKCLKKCKDSYKVEYEEDKRYGKRAFQIIEGENQIRAEVFSNGPVEASFMVYSDFPTYKSGVYKQTDGSALGRHNIKILGWGVENGDKYWLVANSWNSDWGENGFAKILRGENHCGIESIIVAGEPLFVD